MGSNIFLKIIITIILSLSQMCVLFYMRPPHSIFSIHTTLDQSIVTWCLIFQFFIQHHTNVPTNTNTYFHFLSCISFSSLTKCCNKVIHQTCQDILNMGNVKECFRGTL